MKNNQLESLIDYMGQVINHVHDVRVVFDEHGKICGVIWKFNEKKKKTLKVYKAGADASRA